MSISWVCERCPGAALRLVLEDGEQALLDDVEQHRLAVHRDDPGADRWIEHDDWERVVGDWFHCPLCRAPLDIDNRAMTWQCGNAACTLSQGTYSLDTIQLVGP